MKTENREERASERDHLPREVYTSPELIVHGSVKEITRDTSVQGSDGFAGSNLGED